MGGWSLQTCRTWRCNETHFSAKSVSASFAFPRQISRFSSHESSSFTSSSFFSISLIRNLYSVSFAAILCSSSFLISSASFSLSASTFFCTDNSSSSSFVLSSFSFFKYSSCCCLASFSFSSFSLLARSSKRSLSRQMARHQVHCTYFGVHYSSYRIAVQWRRFFGWVNQSGS